MFVQALKALFGKQPVVSPYVTTPRAGVLHPGQYVIQNGFLGILKDWTQEHATIEYVCYTAGTRGNYDKSSKGAVVRSGIHTFRAATDEEVIEYTSEGVTQ